jgi:iron(III) transport system ATP-binding protein
VSPAARQASLLIDDVTFAYGDLAAVDRVSLAVSPGDILCLLGHSGCGKTTLLRLAAGLERPARGRILLDGREVCGPKSFVPPELRGVGMMFQDYALFPHLTVEQNIAFGLSRRPPERAREIVRRALARVGLARYAGNYPHMLSGGEQQRVALARALAPEPAILLMDEPFSNLDHRTRAGIRDETIGVLRENGITAVVVTHDPAEAIAIADHIALMRAGRVEQIGTPDDLYLRPRSLFAARFFSDLNEFEGHCRGGGAHFALGAVPAPLAADGPCLVAVRPHDVVLEAPEQDRPRGRIVDRRFMGEFALVRIALDGVKTLVKAHVAAGDGCRPDEIVAVRADATRTLVFAAAAGEQA